MKKIKVSNNTDVWHTENVLKARGYKKVSDCYWFIHFKKGIFEIAIER